MITLLELAGELSTDSSTLRKRIRNRGVPTIKIKHANRLKLGLSDESASTVRSWYKDIVDAGENQRGSDFHYKANSLYVIQTTPDTKPERIKIGMATNVEQRMSCHRCSSPTLVVRRIFPADVSHETILKKHLCSHAAQVGEEVFDVANLDASLARIDAFFCFLDIVPTFKR